MLDSIWILDIYYFFNLNDFLDDAINRNLYLNFHNFLNDFLHHLISF